MHARERVTSLATRASVAIALALTVASLATPALGGDVEGRDWFMPGANPERTSRVTVEPIRAQPTVAWRRKLDEGLVCAPVVWNGTIFAISFTRSGGSVLYALDAATGEVLARTVGTTGVSGKAEMYASQGLVLVVQPGSTQAYSYRTRQFSPSWKRDKLGVLVPLADSGLLLAQGPDGHSTVNVVRMKDGRTDLTFPCPGAPPTCLGWTTKDELVFGGAECGQSETRDDLQELFLRTWSFARPAPGRPVAAPDLGRRQICWSDPNYGSPRVVRCNGAPGKHGGWFVLPGDPIRSAEGTRCGLTIVPDRGETGLLPVDVEPAVHLGVGYAPQTSGGMMAIGTDGRFEQLIEGGNAPPGAVYGRPSIASGVLYMGNWAVDLDSRRVLWVHPVPTGTNIGFPTIPTGDGLAILRVAGELICLADPRAKAAAVKPAEPTAAGTSAPPPPLPRDADGALLADGRQIDGVVTVTEMEVTVTPAGGAPQKFPRPQVLVAVAGGKVLCAGTESEVHRVWRDALRGTIGPRLLTLTRSALDLGIATRARELLDLARAWGGSEAEAAELAKTIATKRDVADASFRMREQGRREAAAFEQCAADVLAGTKWCGARRFPTAGAALLGAAERLLPGRSDFATAGDALVPAEFPWRGTPRSGALWAAWARHLVRCDARFLDPNDPSWQRLDRRNGTVTLGLRTPHMLLFATTFEPDVVGPCLRQGEEAVRALHTLLGLPEPVPAKDDSERMDVRLYRDQKEYLANAAMPSAEFTLGCFSPRESVSRFFVPEPGTDVGSAGRGLFKVLAHELTHHFVEWRWLRLEGIPSASGGDTPGYWIVEGLARFVEDQVVDSEFRGLNYDDATVPSVDAAAQLASSRKLLDAAWIVDASHRQFHGLGKESTIDVRLRRSLVEYQMSETNVFYEQAGALVFWLWNARGADGRAALVTYLRDYYGGRTTRGSFAVLGFKSAAELSDAFTAWLASLPR